MMMMVMCIPSTERSLLIILKSYLQWRVKSFFLATTYRDSINCILSAMINSLAVSYLS